MAKASEEARKAADELRQALQQLEKFIEMDAPKIVGEEYVKEVQRAIDDGRSPDGKRHAPLAERSKYPSKKKRNPLNQILRDTNVMRNSVDFEDGKARVEIYIDGMDSRGREPATYHQKDSARMPRRQVLTRSNTAARLINRRLLQKARSISNALARKFAEAFADDSNFGE